ncbi:NAD(P)-dependent oxidoreductase, partial [Campylobacter sp.]|uniref:NAD(P)-dependent oxidoreductase n=1 Tax=Campylobacter sp. TaxID=205 RepID=UPI003F9EF4BA
GANKNSEFKQKSLDELLRGSDIISIHAPLNEKTRNLLGANEINLLKNDAIVLNLGRGGIVDEAAMARAIDERNLRFGTDVLEREPMSENSPFLNVKKKSNLLITPHVAWGSLEARKTLIAKIVANIENFIKESR